MKNKKVYLCSAILSILICIFLILAVHNNETTEITQLSPQGSRQMMGYLIKTYNGKLIAIDGGTTEDTENLVNNINKNGGKVDYWFLTHAHDDHCGAFVQAINDNKVQVEKIYVSLNDKEWYEKYEPTRAEFSILLIDTLNKEEVKDKVNNPQLNEILQIDNIKAEILGVNNPEITENPGNEQSMVIRFDTGKTGILILGDTGEGSSKKLLEANKEKLDCDIVQVAHHGQAGATKELYEAVSPKICLWPTIEWLWNNDAGEGIRNWSMENI